MSLYLNRALICGQRLSSNNPLIEGGKYYSISKLHKETCSLDCGDHLAAANPLYAFVCESKTIAY